MKVALSSALSVLIAASAAHGAEVVAQSSIDAVTVFPSGAEVTRKAKVKLEHGDHVVIFRDLPAGAVEGSIRVEGNATGKLEIGSVDTLRTFVLRADAEASESERRLIETEIEKLKDEKAGFESAVHAAETQKSLIANLTQLPTRPQPAQGAERGEDWTAILALIASGSADAQRALTEAQAKMRETDRRIEDLEKKLGTLSPAREERTEAKVFVTAQSAVEVDLTVQYQVQMASWTPLYDVRLATGGKTDPSAVELTRRAAINQQSGEAWENVAIVLSTTRPSAGASAPELYPVAVDFEPEPPRPMAMAPSSRMEDGIAAPQPPAMAEAAGEEEQRPVLRARKAAVQKSADVTIAPFQALYAVPGRLSIPDTGETKRVQLMAETIEPQLTVRTVPKADAKAYLYAKFTLPKGSPLLPGAVSLFRDGTFVGTGRLPMLSPGQEHELGFGVDDLVRVRHAIAEEKRGETGLISTSRTDLKNYRISVKSMHERAIALSVYDQVPVSENQEIRVEMTAKPAVTKQNVDDKRGVLVWESKLEPEQEQVIEFGYRVTWPSAKAIIYR